MYLACQRSGGRVLVYCFKHRHQRAAFLEFHPPAVQRWRLTPAHPLARRAVAAVEYEGYNWPVNLSAPR